MTYNEYLLEEKIEKHNIDKNLNFLYHFIIKS